MTTSPPPEPLAEMIAPQLAGLDAARQAFTEAFGRYTELSERVASFEKSAQACETEAMDAKARLRAILREGVGKLNKKAFDLKGEERAAYSLAEEYRSMGQIVALDRDKVALELNHLGRSCRTSQDIARKALVDAALERALAALPVELGVAVHLQTNLEEFDRNSDWHQFPGDSGGRTALDFVFNKLKPRLLEALSKSAMEADKVLPPALVVGFDLHGFTGNSAIAMNQQKSQLEERERALATLE